MKTRLVEQLDRHRFLLAVIALLVCGGGCMTLPYVPQSAVDLRKVGIDDQTHARLDGRADPDPNGPTPVAGMNGTLLVVEIRSTPYGHDWGYISTWPDASNYDPNTMFFGYQPVLPPRQLTKLNALEGIDNAASMPVVMSDYQDLKPLTRASLLQSARDAGGDLILVYTASTGADTTDVTLSIGAILSLGFAPTVVVSGEAQIEAVLIDAHTGYIYALAETEGDALGMSNSFGRESGKRSQATEAIQEALGVLIDRLDAAWPDLRAAYP